MKLTTRTISYLLLSASLGGIATASEKMTEKQSIGWDSKSLIIDGRRAVPVMGEIHYSRLPREEWPQAIRKMKEGGVTIIATYVFWNHHEERESVFDWSGQRDLRHFL